MPSLNRETLKRQTSDRLASILFTCSVLLPVMSQTALAQPSPEVEIDRIFRYDSPAPGSYGQAGLSGMLQKWLGAYQRTVRDDNNYVVVFDRASLQLLVDVKDNGSFKSFTIGCPVTKSLPLSDAPEDIQRLLSRCRNSNSKY
jgi:hypothetical protein